MTPEQRLATVYHAVRWRNRTRRIIFDILSDRREVAAVENFCLMREESQPFTEMPFEFDQEAITAAHRLGQTETHETYLYRLRQRAYIEPKYGYVITPRFSLLDRSISYSSWTRSPEYLHLVHVPSALRFAIAKTIRASHVRYEPRVISLRFPWDNNYFHFFNDVLAKIPVLERAGIDRNIPLLISKHLAEQSFFQQAMKRSQLQDRPIIIQDGYILADEVIFCQPSTQQRVDLDRVLDLLNVPVPAPAAEGRIFLTRSRAAGRCLENGDEIESICKEQGFRVIDTGAMSLDQQIDEFGAARYVVGIHGAGLVNILFRRGRQLGLLEIYPPPLRPAAPGPPEVATWFSRLSQQYGYDYVAVQGYSDTPRFDRMESFKLDPELFRRNLCRLLKT